MKLTVTATKEFFKEGMLVCPIDRPDNPFIVVPAYDKETEDTRFWAMDMSTMFIGGNYLKSLFVPFRGKIVMEV